MHYWEYTLLCPRQFKVIAQTESASWSIAPSQYTLFSWIHIIMVFFRALWKLTLNTELGHWKLSLRKILPWKIFILRNLDRETSKGYYYRLPHLHSVWYWLMSRTAKALYLSNIVSDAHDASENLFRSFCLYLENNFQSTIIIYYLFWYVSDFDTFYWL